MALPRCTRKGPHSPEGIFPCLIKMQPSAGSSHSWHLLKESHGQKGRKGYPEEDDEGQTYLGRKALSSWLLQSHAPLPEPGRTLAPGPGASPFRLPAQPRHRAGSTLGNAWTPVEKVTGGNAAGGIGGAFAGLASSRVLAPTCRSTCGSPAAPAPFAEPSLPRSHLADFRRRPRRAGGLAWPCWTVPKVSRSRAGPRLQGGKPSDRPAARHQAALRTVLLRSFSRVFYAERINEFPPPPPPPPSPPGKPISTNQGCWGRPESPCYCFFFLFFFP